MVKQTKILTQATHVNGWFPAVYMGFFIFRLFHVTFEFFCSCIRAHVRYDGGGGPPRVAVLARHWHRAHINAAATGHLYRVDAG